MASCSRTDAGTEPPTPGDLQVGADVLAAQRDEDEQVICALRDAGSDLSKPHAIEPSRRRATGARRYAQCLQVPSPWSLEYVDDPFAAR